ncbi:MAG: hypothetical protein IK080_03035 [Clostridia bacterium]|nr:hypothetical protein [Clostridia bacterium]
MNIKTTFTDHDRAAMTALYLQDGMRVLVIIDDGTATIPQPGYESLIDSQLPNVIDGNSEALAYVADRAKTIQVYDQDYKKHDVQVNDQTVYVFRMAEGRLAVTTYAGASLRQLLINGL